MAVLAVAVITGNTVIALAVIGLATVGLLLLARDWLKQRQPRDTAGSEHPEADKRRPEGEVAREDRALNPDMFEPDVSYDEALEDATEDEDFDVEDEGDSET